MKQKGSVTELFTERELEDLAWEGYRRRKEEDALFTFGEWLILQQTLEQKTLHP